MNVPLITAITIFKLRDNTELEYGHAEARRYKIIVDN